MTSKFFPVNKDELNKVSDSKLFFIKEGVTQLRILPPYSARGSWFREVKEHTGTINGEFTTATCPRTQNKACIYCDEGQRLYSLGTEADVEKAKKFRPKLAYLFNIMVYSSPNNVDLTKGVLVLKSGIKVKRQIMDHDQDAAGGWGDITSLTSGFDIRITKKGKGQFDTEYFVKGVPSRNSLLDTLKKQGLSTEIAPHDLDQILMVRPDIDLKQMFEEFNSAPGFTSTAAKVADVTPVGDEVPTAPTESANLVNVTAPPAE